jgi:hypothetical protein
MTMKRRFLPWFAVIVALGNVAIGQAQTQIPDPVDELHGTWSYIVGNAVSNTYSCPQATGIGDGRTWACSVELYGGVTSCNVTYNVTFSSNVFSYNAVYISGTCPVGQGHGNWSGTLTVGLVVMCDVPVNEGTCINNFDNFRTAGPNGFTDITEGQSVKWEVPGTISGSQSNGGENASADKGPINWQQGGTYYTGTLFTATLNDPKDTNYNFAGHLTQEFVSASGNTCLPISFPPSNQWVPDWANNYSVGNGNTGSGDYTFYDVIGLPWSYILAVQSGSSHLPCTVSATQSMAIDYSDDLGPNPKWWIYETHPLQLIIGDGTVQFTRHGKGAQRRFGNNRSTWRWDQWWRTAMLAMPFWFS